MNIRERYVSVMEERSCREERMREQGFGARGRKLEERMREGKVLLRAAGRYFEGRGRNRRG